MDDIPVQRLAHLANAIAIGMAAVSLSSWVQRNGNIAQHKDAYLELYGAKDKTAHVHLGWSFWLVMASLALHLTQWIWTVLTSYFAQPDDPQRMRYRRLANMSTEELIAYAQQARRKRQPAPKYREPHHLFLAEPPAYCEVMRSGFEREQDTVKLAARPFAPDVFATHAPPLLTECVVDSRRRTVTDEPLGGWGRGRGRDRGRGRGRGAGRGAPAPSRVASRGPVSWSHHPRSMSPSSHHSFSSLQSPSSLRGGHPGHSPSSLHRSFSQPARSLAQPGLAPPSLARASLSPQALARQRQAFQAAQQRYQSSASLMPSPSEREAEADALAAAADLRLSKLMRRAGVSDPAAPPSATGSRRWANPFGLKKTNTGGVGQEVRFVSQGMVGPSRSRVAVASGPAVEQAEPLLASNTPIPATRSRVGSRLFAFREPNSSTTLPWNEGMGDGGDDDVILDLSPGSEGIPLSRQTASPDPSPNEGDANFFGALPDTARRRDKGTASFLQILDYDGNTDDEEAEA